MTIKIEREAVLCVTSGASHLPSRDYHNSHRPTLDDSGESTARSPTLVSSLIWGKKPIVGNIGKPTVSELDQHLPELDDTDDDSTISSSSSNGSVARSVTFADALVTEVRTRPRTSTKDIKTLFYSYDDTQRFRQDYRHERKMQSLEDADRGCSTRTGEDGSNQSKPTTASGDASGNTHRISRVVVMHENTRETFFDKEHFKGMFQGTDPCHEASDDFFDNHSFWSGQITWY